MNPAMLRQLWALVETTQATQLLNLDDTSLVQCLLHQYRDRQVLNSEETTQLSTYIRSRLGLIRDLAQNRHQHLSV
jgi:hypothetical protein